MISIGIFFVCLWLIRSGRAAFGIESCDRLIGALREVQVHLLTGAYDWRLTDFPALPDALGQTLEWAMLQGHKLNYSLTRLEKELRHCRQLCQERRDLERVYWARGIMMAITALMMKLYSLSNPTPVEVSYGGALTQCIDGALAAGIYASGHLILRVSTSCPWPVVALRAHGHRLANWFAVHVDGIGDGRHSDLWSQRISSLTARELMLGVSLLSDKRRCLEEWSREELVRVRRRLQLAEDYLPAIELGGLGISLIILIFRDVAALL